MVVNKWKQWKCVHHGRVILRDDYLEIILLSTASREAALFFGGWHHTYRRLLSWLEEKYLYCHRETMIVWQWWPTIQLQQSHMVETIPIFFSGYQSHVVEFFMPKENYDSSLVQGTILAGTGSFFTLLLLSRNYIFVSINTTLHNIDNYCSQTKETQTMKNNEIKSKKYQQHGANIFSSTCQLM